VTIRALLVSDIDDTLLSKGDEEVDLLEFASSLPDCDIVFATARPLSTLSILPWPRNVVGLIPYNGICFFCLTSKKVLNLLTLPQRFREVFWMNALFLSREELFIASNPEQFEFLQRSDSRRNVVLANDLVIEMPSMLNFAYKHSMALDKRGTFERHDVQILDYPETRFGEGIRWLEVVPAIASKEFQVEFLKGMFKPELMVGLGNGWNDIGFLKMMDRSLCPSDAEPKVRNVCTLVADFPGGASFRRGVLDEVKRWISISI
jgi:hydroxymethylpyrimidine pyrophosphatase-like HAD family hydrolase